MLRWISTVICVCLENILNSWHETTEVIWVRAGIFIHLFLKIDLWGSKNFPSSKRKIWICEKPTISKHPAKGRTQFDPKVCQFGFLHCIYPKLTSPCQHTPQTALISVCWGEQMCQSWGWRSVSGERRGEWGLHVYSSMGRGLSLLNSCAWSMAADSCEPDNSQL